MTSILEGARVDHSASASVTLRDLLCQAQKSFRFASFTEAAPSGITRSVLVSQLWSKTGALVQELVRTPQDPNQPLLVCFETTQELIVGVWASILLQRDAYVWQILTDGGTTQSLRRRAERVRSALGEGVLITHPSLVDQSWLEPLRGEDPPICPCDLPTPDSPDWIPDVVHRDARFLLETSGTTGDPKIGVLTHQDFAERSQFSVKPDPTVTRLSMLTFDSISGLAVLIPQRNRTLLMHPLRFTRDPEDYLQMALDYRAKNLVFSTTFAQHLLDRVESSKWEGVLDGLDSIAFGLEQVVPGVVWTLMDQIDTFAGHPVKLGIGYGMTETGLLTASAIDMPSVILPERGASEPASVGSCMPGRRLRVVDDAGVIVQEGDSGRIEAQVDYGLLAGYIHVDGSFTKLEVKDGWFQTGDLGFISQQKLTVVGRQKAVLVSGGRNIPLASFDLALQDVEGLQGGYVAALAVTDAETKADQLVVAYALSHPGSVSEEEMTSRCRDAVSRCAPVPVSRVLCLSATDFPFTTSGKLRRGVLAEHIQGLLQEQEPSKERPYKGSAEREDFDPVERELARIWQECLPEGVQVMPGTHFFEAGGDSLKAAVMVEMAEQCFCKRIPLGYFFQEPRLNALARYIRVSLSVIPDVTLSEYQRVLRRQLKVMNNWSGDELFPGSLMHGYNRQGRQRPLFWVFQYHEEAQALAAALGSDYPLYAFHSWHHLIDIPDLESPLAESLADRMLWEVLGACHEASPVLGGNCQGGVPALTMARKMVQLGRVPHTLILSEWVFAGRSYMHPVHLIYGSESPVSCAYEKQNGEGASWAEIFPQATTQELPIGHGLYFRQGNVEAFADLIRPFLKRGKVATLRQGVKRFFS